MEHLGRGGGGALFRTGTQTLKGGEARGEMHEESRGRGDRGRLVETLK
jgi:hypothetical protein